MRRIHASQDPKREAQRGAYYHPGMRDVHKEARTTPGYVGCYNEARTTTRVCERLQRGAYYHPGMYHGGHTTV